MAIDDLSRRSSLDSAAALNELQKLGRKLAALLDFEPQDQTAGKRLLPLLVLAKVGEVDQEGAPLLAFHDELCEAIRNLPPQRLEPRLVGSR